MEFHKMIKLTLEKNGFVTYEDTGIDGDDGSFIVPPEMSFMIGCEEFNHYIAEGVNVETFFKLMNNYPGTEYLVSGARNYKALYNNDTLPEAQDNITPLDWIVITHVTEVTHRDNTRELIRDEPDEFGCTEVNFGDPTPVDESDASFADDFFSASGEDKEHPNWGLDFIPVRNLLNVPIKIGPHYASITSDIRYDEKGNLTNLNNKNIMVETECFPTILDVFREIMVEITFHGVPEERKRRLGKIEEAVESVEQYGLGEDDA